MKAICINSVVGVRKIYSLFRTGYRYEIRYIEKEKINRGLYLGNTEEIWKQRKFRVDKDVYQIFWALDVCTKCGLSAFCGEKDLPEIKKHGGNSSVSEKVQQA